MTRLRFTLKDNDLVNRENLISHKGIMTAQIANNQYQVVVGTQVGEIYQEILPKLDLKSTDASTQNMEVKTKKTILNRMIDAITKTITPTLGVLMGCALVLGLNSLLVALGVLSSSDGAYIIFNAIGNALFTFFPIILGYTSAKAYRADGFIGMIIGASLVFPNIVQDLNGGEVLYTLFEGTSFATDIYSTFFGIPIIFPENGYTSTVIPIILAMFFIAKLESFLKKKISPSLHFTFVPFLTIFIGVPLTVLVFVPIANVASDLITLIIVTLHDFSSVLTAVFVGLFYTPLVILGLHWPLVAIGINNLATMGSDFLMPMIFAAPLAQMAVLFAVYLKTKKKETKELCIPAMISAFFCIIEPAIYGVTLPVKRRFAITCIGTAVASVIIAGFGVVNYASTIGVLGAGGFINPQTGDIHGLITAALASLACMVVSFVLTYFTEKEEKQVPFDGKLVAVSDGKVMDLSSVKDETFASRAMGEGIAFELSSDIVTAPASGKLTMIFNTNHAFGIKLENGAEVLVHIGLNTVEANGDGFTALRKVGEDVNAGDPILKVKRKKLQEKGYDLTTMVLISNAEELPVNIENVSEVKAGKTCIMTFLN